MATLSEIVSFLDENLRTSEIPDYSGALNGLQLENAGSVTRVVSAVDASLPVIKKAVDAEADLLIVHHGMFWQGSQRLTKATYQKIKLCIDAGLAIYSSHIPLDIHPVWGNNVQLAQRVGLSQTEEFFDWKGVMLGRRQMTDVSLRELHERVSHAVSGPVHMCPAGSDQAGMVGIITGGAGSEVAAMAEQGINTFITGEGPHWSYPLAEELGINVLYAGHYATETFGVCEVANVLAKKFQLQIGQNGNPIHHPTGL